MSSLPNWLSFLSCFETFFSIPAFSLSPFLISILPSSVCPPSKLLPISHQSRGHPLFIATLQHCNIATLQRLHLPLDLPFTWSEARAFFISVYFNTKKLSPAIRAMQLHLSPAPFPSLFNWVLSFRYFDPFPRCAAKMHVMAQIAQHNNNSLSPFN